jgi:hypothetical protein
VTVGELDPNPPIPPWIVYSIKVKRKTQMDRKFHTVSIEDREMFAYNKRHNDLQKHLAQVENRIKYSYEFYNDFQDDREMQLVAFEKSLHYISIVEDQTAHF